MEKLASTLARTKCSLAALAMGAVLAPLAHGAHGEKRLVVMVEERTLLDWPALEVLARGFERDHPGVHVVLMDEAGASGARDKVKFMLAGNLQLDVTRLDVTEIAAFTGEGALVDLEPYFRADPTFDPKAYYAAPLAALRDASGHLYGLPSTFTPYVMYYNRDLLERCGIARPREGWTWEDLRAACRLATRDTDADGHVDQFGISLTQWLQAVVPWIWQNGGDLVDARCERSRLGETEAVEALQFLHALLHEDKVASFDASFANQLGQGLFQAGRAAFYGPVGYWETYRFRSITSFRWDVVPLPQKRAAATSVAMTCYVVPRTAAEPELAYEFVRRLGGLDFQKTLAEIGNGVPGLRAAAESPSFLKPDVPPASERVFLDVMPNARFMPPLANWRKIESLCQAELEGCLLVADYDVPSACARMAQKTDEFLAHERERRNAPQLPRGTIEACVALSCIGLCTAFLARRRARRGVRRGAARPGRLERRAEREAHTLLAPWALGFLFFLFAPAIASLVLALCEWSPLRPLDDVRWVGLDNVARLFHDGTFASSLGATALYAVLSVPLSLGLALGLALLVRGEDRVAGLARTLIYVPAILSPVIVGALWRWLLDADDGAWNALLAQVGISGPAWLRDPHWVVPSFVIVSLWSVGAQMLVFVAALQALDPSLTEAARIDGAGAWSRFRHVIVPQISPVILFNLVTGTVAAFQVFAQAYVMTGGGPGDASRFLVLYLYESGFRHFDMGYASAIAWALFVILALLLALFFRTSRRWVHYAGPAAAAAGGSA